MISKLSFYISAVRDTLLYSLDSRKFIDEKYAESGQFFRANLLFNEVLFLLGPEANAFVLKDQNNYFSSKGGWEFLFGKYFKNGLVMKDGTDHRLHRRAIQSAFKRDQLEKYRRRFDVHCQASVNGLPSNSLFIALPWIRRLMLTIVCDIFLGFVDEKKLANVEQAFQDMVKASTTPCIPVLTGHIHDKADRGRVTIEDFIDQFIANKEQPNKTTLISNLLSFSEDEQHLSHSDVKDHLVFFLLASFDTTTSLATNCLFHLAKHPQTQSLARKELLSNDALDSENEGGSRTLDYCILETLRIFPPAQSIFRRSTKSFMWGGTEVNKGTLVAVNVPFSCKYPGHWSNPGDFDPLRFSSERMEHKANPDLWIPFGAGAHKCIGMHFSTILVTTFLSKLLKQFTITLPEGYQPKFQYSPIVVPKDGLPIRLTSIE